MKLVIVVNGGIGKNIGALGAIQWLRENVEEIERIVVVASHPSVFRSCEDVEVFSHTSSNLFDLFPRDKWEWIDVEVYRERDWYEGRRNISSQFVVSILKFLDIRREVPAEIVPRYRILKDEELRAEIYLMNIISKTGNRPVVLYQPFGGWAYETMRFTGRELDIKIASELGRRIEGLGVVLIQVKSDKEPAVCNYYTQGMGIREVIALLSKSETFVGVDSFLQHAGASVGKRGVVIWGSTHYKQNGYSMHINIVKNNCDIQPCRRPAWGFGLDMIATERGFESWSCRRGYRCMEIDIEEVEKALRELIKI